MLSWLMTMFLWNDYPKCFVACIPAVTLDSGLSSRILFDFFWFIFFFRTAMFHADIAETRQTTFGCDILAQYLPLIRLWRGL